MASQFGPGEGLGNNIKNYFATAQTSTGLVCKALYLGLSIIRHLNDEKFKHTKMLNRVI
jgi:hypothetical protein